MHKRTFLFVSLFLCSAGLAFAQQNRAYTGGSGDGYSMAEIQVHANPTGLQEVLEQAIQLYPNPLQQGEVLVLQVDPSAHIRQIVLRNAAGRLLFEYNPPQHQQSTPLTIPTDRLPAGMYILHLSGEHAGISKKIVLL